jgi:hypothetical protein
MLARCCALARWQPKEPRRGPDNALPKVEIALVAPTMFTLLILSTIDNLTIIR